MKKRQLLAAPFLLYLAACGFRLKGTAGGHLKSLQLHWENGSDSTFENVLKSALQQQNITVSDNATLRVSVNPTRHDRVRTAIGGQGNIQEIELIDSIHVRVEKDGVLLSEQTFSSRSNVSYRRNAYLGSTQEEEEVHQQLARDNADKLIRYLDARTR